MNKVNIPFFDNLTQSVSTTDAGVFLRTKQGAEVVHEVLLEGADAAKLPGEITDVMQEARLAAAHGVDSFVGAKHDPVTGRIRYSAGDSQGYLDSPLVPYPLALSADSPTITNNATATITGGQTLDPDHAALTYYSHSGLFRMGGYLVYNNGGQLTQLEFMTNSAALEIGIIRYTAQFRVFVDGLPASAALSNDAAGSAIFYKLAFASRKVRRITVVGVNMPIYQIVTSAGDAIWQAPDDQPLMCVAGDSYTFGNGGAGGVCFAWSQLFGRGLGYRVIVDAIGGTGWNSSGSNAPLTRLNTVGANVMTKRIAGVNSPRVPDAHVAAFGYNDAGGDMGSLAANAAAYIQASIVKPVLIGPWTPQGDTSPLTSAKSALASVAAAQGVKFVDASGLVDANNKASLTDVDNVHPTIDGHSYLAHRLAVRARASGAA